MIRGELPSSQVRLGDVVEFLDHRRRPITAKDRIPGDIPYYGANGQQDSVDGHIFDEPLVLLAEDGGYFDNPSRGIAYRIEGKSWVNNHAHVLRPRAGTDTAFLARILEHYDVRPFLTGTTRAKLTKAAASRIPVSLPPLDEQRRIAAILDKADALRTKRSEALAHLDTLTQSIFHSMFGSADQSWPELTIDELADRQRGAIRTGPFGSQLLTSEFTDEGIAVLGIDNAVTNHFAWKERRYISLEKYETLRRYTVRPGDLLVTIMGTLGRCAVVPSDIPLAINTKHLCCITLNRELAVPEWLHSYFLRSDVANQYLRQTTKGAIMGGLNMGIIKKMPVLLPPLELQQNFATRVEAVQRLKETHRKHLAELDALFASLQHRAFKGEL